MHKKKGYVELKKRNPWIRGTVMGEFNLTLWQKIKILFSHGVLITFVGIDETEYL